MRTKQGQVQIDAQLILLTYTSNAYVDGEFGFTCCVHVFVNYRRTAASTQQPPLTIYRGEHNKKKKKNRKTYIYMCSVYTTYMHRTY